MARWPPCLWLETIACLRLDRKWCVFVCADGNLSILPGGVFNRFGNDIKTRTQYFRTGAARTFVDTEIKLPNGTLTRFFLFILNTSTDAACPQPATTFLQIWRPVSQDVYTTVFSQSVRFPKRAVSQLYTVREHSCIQMFEQKTTAFPSSELIVNWVHDYASSHSANLKVVVLLNPGRLCIWGVSGWVVSGKVHVHQGQTE